MHKKRHKMSPSTFMGGIHPPGSKFLTESKEIELLTPTGELVYPMSQHLGAPCAPIVKKGGRVLVVFPLELDDRYWLHKIDRIDTW
jgi:electron transport complex protein RnfC